MSSDVYPSALPPATGPDQHWQYRIFLGIDHPQNRQLLAGLLRRFYSLIEAPPERAWEHSCDLCIFDSLFFGRFAQQIVAQRRAAQPVFCPVCCC
jgi:two-component system, chemotaxis family, response regulator WspR